MTHLSLFSGIGGIDLAAHWAGFRTVAFVEKEPYCRAVLAKNFPGIPIHDDINTFDAEPFRGRIDLLTGGFPCQDISNANPNAKGLAGERSGLWFAMLHVIQRVRPRFVVAENVPALKTRGLDVVLCGMEEAGYTCEAYLVGADDVGAPHRRKRIFIVGERLADADGGERSAGDREPGRSRETAPDRAGELAHGDPDRQQQPGGTEREERRRAGDGGSELGDASGGGRRGESRRRAGAQSADRHGGVTAMAHAEGDRRHGRIAGDVSEALGGGESQSAEIGRDCSMADTAGVEGGQRRDADPLRGRADEAQQIGVVGRVGHADDAGREEQCAGFSGAEFLRAAESTGGRLPEPRLGGTTNGIPGRLDGDRWPAPYGAEQYEWEAPRLTTERRNRRQRLHAIGNAVVPQQVYPLLACIAERIQEVICRPAN